MISSHYFLRKVVIIVPSEPILVGIFLGQTSPVTKFSDREKRLFQQLNQKKITPSVTWVTTDACQRSLIKMGFCVLICCCAWATQLGLFTGSIKALTISNCPCRVWNLKARRLKAKIATKPVSKVQLCGCCDVQSGWKFISEVAGNLSPIHPSGGSKKIHPPSLFNFLWCTSQSSIVHYHKNMSRVS